MIKTHRFYDSHKRRLSIYAEESGDNLDISVIVCSDLEKRFEKKEADKLYANYKTGVPVKVNPLKFTIPIENKKPGQTLLKWARSKYKFYVEMDLKLVARILISAEQYNKLTEETIKARSKREAVTEEGEDDYDIADYPASYNIINDIQRKIKVTKW